MNKKSQGLSINVIIIVAIALIVLVVLIAVFTGRLGNFITGVDRTVTCESSCDAFGMDSSQDTEANCNRPNRVVQGTYSDVTLGNVCCCVPGQDIEGVDARLKENGESCAANGECKSENCPIPDPADDPRVCVA